MTRDMADAHETARERDAYRTRTHAINPTTGEFTPLPQETPMPTSPSTITVRLDPELVALLTEIRDRLPEPEGVNAVEDGPTDITEEPPVGSQVTDGMGDVWERREEGWALWWSERSGWVADLYEGELDPWPVVRDQAPLRFTTDEDRKRVGLPVDPAPADDLPGEPVEPPTRERPGARPEGRPQGGDPMSRRPVITATYQRDPEELVEGGWTGAPVVAVTPGINLEVTFELHGHDEALALLDRAVADIRAQIQETDRD